MALENFVLTILDKRSDADILQYPKPDLKEIIRPRSLILRHLDCGSCGCCELALQRANNAVWDIQRYNINFESSPRHAHALAMTGPFVLNSQISAQKTLEAMPIEAIVAVGDCAVDGGIFSDSISLAERPEWLRDKIVMAIPGCPPSIPEIQSQLLLLSQKLEKVLRRPE